MATTARSDAELAERLRQRDRIAWDELYRAYEGRLYRFAHRLTGNPHDAADLVQETFVRALPRLDRLDPAKLDLAAYLFATAKNLFLKSVERAKRQEPVEEVPEPDEPGRLEEDPQRAALLHSQRQEVRIANARLAPRQRLVLALRELEDKSYAEIGEIVDLSENAVAQLISRARQSLREELRLVQVDRSKLPPVCQAYLPLLSAHLDGQLKRPKLAETLAHLEGCERCQAVLEDMREASRRYRALLPPIAGLVALREQVDEALAASGYWRAPGGSALPRLATARPRLVLVGVLAGRVTLGAVGGATAYLLTRGGEGARAEAEYEAGARPVGGTPTAPVSPAAPIDEVSTEEGAPVVTLTHTPPGTTTEPSATFEFRSSQPGSAFRCRLDDAELARCASPLLLERLRPGGHAFAVWAVDAGGAGPAVRYSWHIVALGASTTRPSVAETEAPTEPEASQPPQTAPAGKAQAGGGQKTQPATTQSGDTEPAPEADRTPPAMTIVSAPDPVTRKTTAVFRFRPSEPIRQVECSLDRGGYVRCYTPTRYTGLPAGEHTFSVRATDRAGNAGPPTSYSWTIEARDTAPPVATITQAPANPSPPSVSFGFAANEPDVGFECQLDGGGFSPCTSPRSYSGLSDGVHTFAVRAIDAAGNRGRAASYSWEVGPKPAPAQTSPNCPPNDPKC